MKEHPILFTGPMVRAILEGRKTQTRRPIKPQPPPEYRRLLGATAAGFVWSNMAHANPCEPECLHEIKRPFAVGDRLWVRETFAYVTGNGIRLAYRADGEDPRTGWDDVPPERRPKITWRPSIHMPRAASRITLEVTSIRPERVQSITEADAIAEGARFFPDLPPDPRFGPEEPHCRWSMYEPKTDAECLGSAAFAFGNAWGHTYVKGPFAWQHNPWVWATTFKVVPQ